MKTVAVAKLVYLYVAHWIVGLEEEGFQIAKGNYLFELERFSGAAEAYRQALAISPSPVVQGALGCCYLNLGLYGKAAELLETALVRRPDPGFETALAWSYFRLGEMSRSRAVVARIQNGSSTLAPWIASELAKLEVELGAP